MKLLLTSAGLANDSIVKSLSELIEKPFDQLNLVFIPTAANVEQGDKGWLIDDFKNCQKLGFKEIDIVDIAAVSQEIWQPRLKNADILLVGGGNTLYLMEQMKKSGLKELLPELLKTRVYIGISAGSMVTSKNLILSDTPDLYNGEKNGDEAQIEALGFVNFNIRPHLNSPWFPKITEEYLKVLSKDISQPVYAIDDETAIKVVDDMISIVSEGKWRKFN